MRTSDTITKLAAALSKAQAEIIEVKADAKNPYFKSEYSTLAACNKAVRGPLSKNGLSVIQCPASDNGLFSLTTRIQHDSGEYIEASLDMTTDKKITPQNLGSLLTYFRRYMLCSMTGLATAGEDDDGNNAGDSVEATKKKKKPAPLTTEQIAKLDELGSEKPFDAFTHFAEWVKVGLSCGPNELNGDQAANIIKFLEKQTPVEDWPEKQKAAFDLARLTVARQKQPAI